MPHLFSIIEQDMTVTIVIRALPKGVTKDSPLVICKRRFQQVRSVFKLSGVWFISLMLPALSHVPFLGLVLVPALLFQTSCRFSVDLPPRG